MLITGSNSSLSDYLPGEVDPPRETFKVPTETTEAMKRVYKIATAPLGEAPHIKHGFSAAPVEWLATLAARTISLPIHLMGDFVDLASKPISLYGENLIGGPRGETGDWTPEQLQTGLDAFNVSVMADIASVPGGGEGVANIGKRDMLKAMARTYREETIGGGTPYQRKAFRNFAKAARDVPQEVLDPIEDVAIKAVRGDEWLGQYTAKTRDVKLSVGTPEAPVDVGYGEARNAVFHEMTHAEDMRPYLDIIEQVKDLPKEQIRDLYQKGKIPDEIINLSVPAREAKAYKAGTLFEKRHDVMGETKVSYDKFKQITDLAEKDAQLKWGKRPPMQRLDEIINSGLDEMVHWRDVQRSLKEADKAITSGRKVYDIKIDQEVEALARKVDEGMSHTEDAMELGRKLFEGKLDPEILNRAEKRFKRSYDRAMRHGHYDSAAMIATKKQVFREAREMAEVLRTGKGPPLLVEAAKKNKWGIFKGRSILKGIKKPLKATPDKNNLGILFKRKKRLPSIVP